ncbi:MAG TPA: polysaccharide deacetylase family protein [Patescibacteria group bacterium]|nr:polysaccharide deacetylase family protein [Patescibacteria group bacterium]
MPKAYLTIDDSPSAHTDALTDALAARNVPALLFCRGDRLKKNPEPIVTAIRKGFVIGNHAWSHTRFSTLSLEDGTKEIKKTDKLIDNAYRKAGVQRSAKYFRFPHMDRGCGGWVVDYDDLLPSYRDALVQLFGGGLNVQLTPPDRAMKLKKQALQDWLKDEGFQSPDFRGVPHSWYNDTEVATAIDTMFTYSTGDWMVTARHLGKWPYKSVDDLKAKIDADPFLHKDGSHIVLMHDQDELLDVGIALVDHLIAKGFVFQKIP